ncbi:MAG: hypothetical protein Q7R32_13060 [Dehalococcoidia bacterium]|nr:hypothetical protein [Dehalococcoidia bacterium]
MKWIRRKVDDLATEIVGGLLLMLLLAGGLVIWSALKSESPPMIVAIAVLAAGGAFLIANQGLAMLRRSKMRSFATPEHLAPAYLRGLTIRIADMVREDLVIRDRTFEECEIFGPAVLIPLGAGVLQECSFEGDPASVFWEIPSGRVAIAGAIGLQDCVFKRCKFRRIGLAGPPEAIEKFRAGFLNA